MKQNEHQAYFFFVGEFDPVDLSARVGMEPTRSWRKGDTNPHTNLEREHSRWTVDSRLHEQSSLEAHVDDVLEQLRPSAEAIRSERDRTDGGLQLVGYFHTDYPGFGLSDRVTAELADMKLGFDCDFYYLYSDKREDSE